MGLQKGEGEGEGGGGGEGERGRADVRTQALMCLVWYQVLPESVSLHIGK